MGLGFVMTTGRGGTDRLLSSLATALEDSTLRICGVVQINTDRNDCVGCDMDVRILSTDTTLRISQSLGPEARGCRLDTSALENAVGLVEATMSNGADLLIINKFGKHEANGRGFRGMIGDALAAGTPVIVGLNDTNRAAFDEFAGDFAEALPDDLDALQAWVKGKTAEAA
ncbi:MAG: DUF2478 domain-containing protein [Pseudomonadota bacterium]